MVLYTVLPLGICYLGSIVCSVSRASLPSVQELFWGGGGGWMKWTQPLVREPFTSVGTNLKGNAHSLTPSQLPFGEVLVMGSPLGHSRSFKAETTGKDEVLTPLGGLVLKGAGCIWVELPGWSMWLVVYPCLQGYLVVPWLAVMFSTNDVNVGLWCLGSKILRCSTTYKKENSGFSYTFPSYDNLSRIFLKSKCIILNFYYIFTLGRWEVCICKHLTWSLSMF